MKSNNCRPILIPCTAPHGVPTLLILLTLSSPFLHIAAAQPPSDSSSSDDDSLQNSSISPSMALIVVVLVLAFFITGTVSFYIQCARSSRSSGLTSIGAGLSRSRRGNAARGLDRSVIEAFPTFVYSSVKELKIGKGSLECAVCLSEFQDSDNLRLLTKCDHVFHSDCIDTWLAAHTTCPVCRANLVPDPADSTIHDADLETEPDPSPSGADGIPCSEVRVTIADGGEGTAVREGIPKRKFPRSHSTGHSLIRPGEDIDRFTLRLPADVRRQLLARAKLKRATSLVALPRASSSRRGYRSGAGEGSGSSRYGRFFGRSLRIGSFRSTAKVGADGDATTSTSTSSRGVFGTAVTPLETLPPLPV